MATRHSRCGANILKNLDAIENSFLTAMIIRNALALGGHLRKKTIINLCKVAIAAEKDTKISLAVLDLLDIATNIVAIIKTHQLDEKVSPLL